MEKRIDFTSGAIVLPLLKFAGPVLLALFLQAMYGAVDLLVVGKFADSADVSAVSTGSQIMATLTNIISSLCMGIYNACTYILYAVNVSLCCPEQRRRKTGQSIQGLPCSSWNLIYIWCGNVLYGIFPRRPAFRSILI